MDQIVRPKGETRLRIILALLMQSTKWYCPFCGDARVKLADLALDHILPIVRGGTNDIGNLQVMCRWCNEDKGTLTMNEWAIQKAVYDGELVLV